MNQQSDSLCQFLSFPFERVPSCAQVPFSCRETAEKEVRIFKTLVELFGILWGGRGGAKIEAAVAVAAPLHGHADQ